MKRVCAVFLTLCLVLPLPALAQEKLELEPVEKELLLKHREEKTEASPKGGKTWLYVLLGIGLLGAAAGGGGGGGGGGGTPIDGSMSVSW